jgi:hypothetical protein
MKSTQDKQKGAGGLKGRLEDYASSARAGATRATLRQRMGNWPIYAAATGSALAMATSASASGITYSGVLDQNLTIPGVASGSLATSEQLGIAPTLYFELSHKPRAGSAGIFAGFNPANGGLELDAAHDGVVKDLASGVAISAGAAGFFSWKSTLKQKSGAGTIGNWVAGVPGFEGFKFGTGHGQFDYGWVELQIGVDHSGYPDSVTLLGMAYSTTPGGAILAGQTESEMPEPGTAGLMLLALGAAGVTLLRKRGRAAQ